MKLLPDKRAILLKLRDPARVTTVIPNARRVRHGGKEYVAVRHGVEEMQVLGNLGIRVPSPIRTYYSWPMANPAHKPFAAQVETSDFLTRHRRAYVLNDLGTGKTLSCLWAYDFLRVRKLVRKMLVVCPLSTLQRTWEDEIFTNFPHLTTAVLHGTREKRLRLLASTEPDIYLVNHDGIKVRGLVDALAERPDIDLIVVDELSQAARNAGTDRWKALNQIINKQNIPRWVWGMTGTPIPKDPTDAWAQCRLITPSTVPLYAGRFRDMVMRQVSQFVYLPREDALDTVHSVMQPAIRFSRDECVDLPPCMYVTREAPLSDNQQAAYREMLSRLRVEVASGELLAVNEAVKAQKLLQICVGAAYGADKEVLTLDATPRLKVLQEVIEESEAKVIVFVPFVAALESVAEFLREKGFATECVHGGVSKADRDRIFRDFQKGTTLRVLVAQPASMSHGLTLTAASTIVWYAPITNGDVFTQANGRITRPGQKNNQLIVMIEGTELERRYYKRLKDKENVQGLLLDMVAGSREAVA